jgi:hypothetical protein
MGSRRLPEVKEKAVNVKNDAQYSLRLDNDAITTIPVTHERNKSDSEDVWKAHKTLRPSLL